jgi:hypothetical protein
MFRREIFSSSKIASQSQYNSVHNTMAHGNMFYLFFVYAYLAGIRNEIIHP